MADTVDRYEFRFGGSDNRGLRLQIARAARSAERGEIGTSIRALARTVALTASGRATLELVARDYETVNREVQS